MIAAIFGFLKTLLGLVSWVWKRKAAKADDPHEQKLRREEQVAREVIRGDERAANRSFADDLDRLRSLPGGERGQGTAADGSGQKPDGAG